MQNQKRFPLYREHLDAATSIVTAVDTFRDSLEYTDPEAAGILVTVTFERGADSLLHVESDRSPIFCAEELLEDDIFVRDGRVLGDTTFVVGTRIAMAEMRGQEDIRLIFGRGNPRRSRCPLDISEAVADWDVRAN